MKKFDVTILIIAVAVVGLILLGVAVPAKHQTTGDAVAAAKVNGKPISEQDFISEMKRQTGKAVLDSLIDAELVKQEATKENLQATPDELKKQYDKFKKRFDSDEKYQQFLKENYLTDAKVKEKLITKIELEKMAEKHVTVTEDEMKKYFNDHKEQFGANPVYEQNKDQIKQIITSKKIRKETKALLAEWRKSAKIERTDAASADSIDSSTK